MTTFDDCEEAPTIFRLRGRQEEWCNKVEEDLKTFSRVLFIASGGVGKSTCFAELARRAHARGQRTLVIINRESLVRQSASRIRNETGLEVDVEMADERASPYAPVVVASVQTLGRVNRLTGFAPDHFGGVMVDECFPCNVLVDGRPISSIKAGDFIRSFNHEKQCVEYRMVVRTSKRIPGSLVQLQCANQKIVTTCAHPFFTKSGYRSADNLTRKDFIGVARVRLCEMRGENASQAILHQQFQIRKDGPAMPEMPGGREGCDPIGSRSAVPSVRHSRGLQGQQAGAPESCHGESKQGILHVCVSGCVARELEKDSGLRKAFQGGPESGVGTNEEKQPNEKPDSPSKDSGLPEGANISCARREWQANGAAKGIGVGTTRIGDGVSDINQECTASIQVHSSLLQGGHSASEIQTGNRGGRQYAQDKEVEIPGFQKNEDIEFHRVDCVKVLERGSDPRFGGLCPDGYVYNLEVEGNNNYFANDFLVHNCHLSQCEQWMRIMNWFHYGPDSLNDGWEPPSDGTYQPLASVIGFTATPILKGPKNLMNWFQHISVNYPYFLAVKEGWLVRAVQRCIPVKIDVRKARTAQTQVGTDFNATDLSAALVPVIEQLADQVLKEAGDRKTMAFLPSVETSKMLAEALCRRGMYACFVSGACEDGDEKTERFRRGGPGSVLCNAQIYNFGIDFPDVNCVAWFRATLSRPFYLQGVFRGTRVLPGVIDGLEDVGARLRAIAASPKPDFLILDPLFMSDKISLCDAFDLFAETPEVKEQMKKEGMEPSQENAEKAERDMLAALEKAAKRAARKKARTIDPLAFAVSLGDDALAHYEPQTQRDAGPPSDKQLALLRQNGLDVSGVKSAGYASMLIGRILTRHRLHLATPKQLSMMTQLGLDEQTCATLSREEATATIDKLLAEKR